MTINKSIVYYGLVVWGALCMQSHAVEQPNIVVIVADDLGYGDIGCYGSETIKTPHIDALAANGLRFTDFHSNGAVCSPTRASLMTGRYPHRTGVTSVITAHKHRHAGLALEETTIAEVVKSAGYRTALFGKWHLGYQPKYNPVHQGFDEYIGFVAGNVDFHAHLDQVGEEDWWKQDQLCPEEGYTTDLITKHGIEFIERNQNQPFLLFLTHEAPHYPYQGRNDPVQYVPGKGLVGSPKGTPETYKEMIEVMDDDIGRIVQTLEDCGLSEKTLIFFCSDNGPAGLGSAGGLRGKKSHVWEGGHRVPGIAYWPGTIEAGRISDEIVMGADLFPTIADLANAPLPEGVTRDGVNLLPHITEGTSLESRPMFWANWRGMAVRQGRYKLVTKPKRFEDPELYDLESDPAEKLNIASEHPEKVEELLKQLKSWHYEVTDGVKKIL
ncbi:sulfatase-like hydrolase/transferase [Pontiella agarivorans]|uniref:Sulfatase-like hydrolase/transferase n=1 Tax=Pontiella agarivorans TaxID=3038953 RepID=A0ABU5MU84_9BACT|nr:sulfatase-like hydrolase/transferase [Pontiella agarivorans]MDZ8117703.1 sulfatase-like hydrolase/transferase [Pontiella agarivorans]